MCRGQQFDIDHSELWYYLTTMKLKRGSEAYYIGVDEVGRGPVAGVVTVCAVAVPKGKNKAWLRGIKDSKKLTKQQREEWFEKTIEKRNNRTIYFAVSSVGVRYIDVSGITKALRIAVGRSLNKLRIKPRECHVFLDGLLYAPSKFKNQKTIVKGDEKKSIIALASIIAKVYRDRKMVRLSKLYPHYGFDVHKGYGTTAHYKSIKKYGICEIHRKSFLKLTNGR